VLVVTASVVVGASVAGVVSPEAASVVAAPAAVVCAAESPDESSLQAANRTSAAMGRARRRDDIR
jgi:hypothetical protein